MHTPTKPKEWLTREIANSYRDKYMASMSYEIVGKNAEMVRELRERCGVTELEAVNILRGANIADYIYKYMRLRIEYEEYRECIMSGKEWKPEKKKKKRGA